MTDEREMKTISNDYFSDPLGESNNLLMKKGETAETVRLIDVLPPENQKRAYELAAKLDPTNHRIMISYGAEAQKKLLSFSHMMIEHVQRKDVGEVGDVVGELMERLNEINPDELRVEKKGFFRRLFSRPSKSVQEVLSNYQKASAQIDRMSVRLERSKNVLTADIHLLEQLYENNKTYFQDLNVYIAAAEMKYEEMTEKLIPEKKKLAEESGDRMKLQEVNDFIHFAELLEKRIFDLKVSREITIQTAPQIRLIQHTNRTVIDKIQSSIMTAIPLWRNQVSIALTLLRQRYAMETQTRINTNRVESNVREMATIANENQSAMQEIESLKETQYKLMNSLEETLQIQEEGKQKRNQAEQEIVQREGNLKQSLDTANNRY
ncbi:MULTISPECIES: toxic anion resistance protein [Bacillaceae]|uniref:toxic anion resistance protein n=1 Tax=Bacillaceae TaxID=186817 RepID=UPI0004E14219|nr:MULTISPECIES: toxic anion resistance protein [Bacillaceae]MCF2649341.1 toxic anion resistance protein [Niallia circulans]MCM3362341.1 toxic anion resistance protein [Niallia sp. MER TA 168]CAI9393178.1 TelA-like protein [Bacillus sp. T2.9-1]